MSDSDYAHPYGDTLPEGATLGRGYALYSSNNRVYFVVHKNGDLELLNDSDETLWEHLGGNASYITVLANGRFCGYTSSGEQMFSTGTSGNDGPYKLVCRDNGNLVVYDRNNVSVWAAVDN
ncbi:hypothetical protein D9757_010482 [Collybiopsis confluens]|uniref:Bulb-type lectin domain-containing protein n=1 Tax=Collybiopsis confluens TaxID=2823264 RepID=A0A8H5GYI6_9AGAR|nr:hypothetical protein D9757_011293 [Collybiopsis confluens]KAF5373518.1 hypothetical protein D9757_010482 [Collybiopsis confluens]